MIRDWATRKQGYEQWRACEKETGSLPRHSPISPAPTRNLPTYTAATALSFLVALDEIKLRLLQAPDGLKSLFYMSRSQYVMVKRAAVKTLCNLASLDEAKVAIVEYVVFFCPYFLL